jgi:flagellar hook protein FlgE
MASTTALFSGLAGLNVNARRLEVIGNNIANVNTTSFKSNRILFNSAFNRTFSLGTGPSSLSGGTNPGQVGLGVGIAGTQRSFANGAINATGINTDLALEGDGFFIVDRGGEQLFTRAGAFQFNSQNDLVTLSGERVLGYGVDDQFNLVEGRLEAINIPSGTLTVAEATREVTLSGNLNADGDIATTGSVITLATFEAGGGAATGATLLTALDPPYAFVDGDILTISGAERGGKVIPDASLTISATTDVDEMMEFVRRALGIYDQGGFDPVDDPYLDDDGSVTIDASGNIIIEGNRGELNDLVIDTTDIAVNSGGTTSNPFAPDKTVEANGESVRTTFVAYDSLGAEL